MQGRRGNATKGALPGAQTNKVPTKWQGLCPQSVPGSSPRASRLYFCRSLTPLGVTGQTYAQAPQPVQPAASISIPWPITRWIALASQRSRQVKQPQRPARQKSLQATATRSSRSVAKKTCSSSGTGSTIAGGFNAADTLQAASTREYRLCLKNSLRLMFTWRILSSCPAF